MVSALHSFTHPTWHRFGGLGHLRSQNNVIICDYVMVEAGGHPKLLPTSILDTCKVFENIDMLSTCIQYQPYWLRFWCSGSLVESKWFDYVMVDADSQHPYWTYTMWLSTLICYPWAYSMSLTQLYPHYFGHLGFRVTCGVKMIWLCHGWGWQPSQIAFYIHIRHNQSIWAHWYAVHGHRVWALHMRR